MNHTAWTLDSNHPLTLSRRTQVASISSWSVDKASVGENQCWFHHKKTVKVLHFK